MTAAWLSNSVVARNAVTVAVRPRPGSVAGLAVSLRSLFPVSESTLSRLRESSVLSKGAHMKMVECVIRMEKTPHVREALNKMGIWGMTVVEARGYGRQKGKTPGGTETNGFVPKVMLKVVIKDRDLARVVEAIMSNARTGGIGDGKIFVTSVEQVVKIRTAERNESAL